MKLETRLKHYFRALHETARRGDAREESFYPALQALLGDWAREEGHEEIHVTVNPRPTEGGNPDFRIWDGSQRVVGYIEAKPPGADLRTVADSEQLQRYRKTFPNLILTDFCEFWLFRDGQPVDKVRAGRALVLTDLDTPPPPENAEDLDRLLTAFLGFSLPRSFDAPTLARELARRTRFLDRIVLAQLQAERKAKKGHLWGFFQAFRKFLLADLTEKQFADLYSQTITYGLFAARTRADGQFSRKNAVQFIPRTIGILHDVFEFLSWGGVSEELAWIVDDIAHVLAVADASAILDRYYKQGRGADPIVHFYETFLAEYDPDERERRGVYYTPEPVVGYIVRSLHKLLQSEFGLTEGLAGKAVTLLDPAAGTMTFVARAVEQAVETFVERYGEGGRESFIRERILPNFYGFELMMAPYAVGHLKMGFYLDELGHRLQPDERFQLYLTDTLEMEKKEQSQLPGMAALAEEAERAHEVKQKVKILVILGNPPYSGHSANTGAWIRGLIEDYKVEPGGERRLQERNPKWLQDDYVKFLRFAEWKIAQAGYGVVGMITNHSWLDNPTFRGMRWHVMQTFDEIHVLDLHGSTKRKEVVPGGDQDKNVFDIQQGVAISFFVKHRVEAVAADAGGVQSAKVFHAEIFGERNVKYSWLDDHDVESTDWQPVLPRPDLLLFTPRDSKVADAYAQFCPLDQLFPVNSVGIVTARDKLCIHWNRDETWETVRRCAALDTDLARQAYSLGKDTRDWKVCLAQQDLRDSGPSEAKITPILYRPFDTRYTYYTGRTRGFHCMPRSEVMRHMMAGRNLALITARSNRSPDQDQFFCSRWIAEAKCGESTTQSYTLPLYLYPDAEGREGERQLDLAHTRQANLNDRLIPVLESAYDRTLSPEDVFHYLYATVYTPTYRQKYGPFLKVAFPRVPFTARVDLFERAASAGERLVALHLLESPELDRPTVRFEGDGDNRVGAKRSDGFGYDETTESVGINHGQRFAPIPPTLWEYRIGGYQVLEKWLKDRKGRRLSTDDIQTYCRIATALAKTIEIQADLDALYPAVEDELLEIRLG